MTLHKDDFIYLRTLVKQKSGISLSDDKAYLIESRLMPVMSLHKVSGFSDLVSRLRLGQDARLVTDIVEAMTTNETSFFRDMKPFDQLRDSLVPWVAEQNKSRQLDIWCAASSTGQEPYSIAMTLMENKHKLPDWRIKIDGTDIDTKVLDKAREGIYTQFEVQRGLPIMLLMKYFTQQESYGEKWLLKDEIKKLTSYSQFNLFGSYAARRKYDIIFCRNVLIYFEKEDKEKIVENLKSCLKPHGVLVIGASESLSGLTHTLAPFKDIRSVFCRP